MGLLRDNDGYSPLSKVLFLGGRESGVAFGGCQKVPIVFFEEC